MSPETGTPAASSTTPAAPAPAPEKIEAKDLRAVAFMALLFLASIGLAMATAHLYEEQGAQAFPDPQDSSNAIVYLVIVIVFTFVLLLIAKYGKRQIIRVIVLGAVLMTIQQVAYHPLRFLLAETPALWASALPAIALTILLYFYPEWWVIDVTGVLVSAGAAAIFGISFGLVPALLLLVAFAAYDAIAVYRTKHMIDLADNVLELRLPIMFVVPKTRKYSFLEETKRLKDKLAEGEDREAMFMGLGDAVIPAVLVVSALTFLPADPTVLGISGALVVALASLLGGLLGYCALMWFVLKGNPQAGLPLLNSGTILGFLAAMVPLYGFAPLLPG